MIRISHPTREIKGVINLPASKSISNRMLMLKHMYEPSLKLENLSAANDTILLTQILKENIHNIDVQDAGTVFRFLVAYCASTSGAWTIRGTKRLHQRPISKLVDALRLLGADIEYLDKENYAPLKIVGKKLVTNQEIIDLSQVESSQFITALLLIAPKIEGNFEIKINPKMQSLSYVSLTISAMRRTGFSISRKGSYFTVGKQQKFDGEYFKIEPDWTSFYYWLSIAHLGNNVDLEFPGIKQNSMSKDRKKLFDVGADNLQFENLKDGFKILKNKKEGSIELSEHLSYNQYPDLAPTIATLIPALGVKRAYLTGLESLKYKECDREFALNEQLKLVGANLTLQGKKWVLECDTYTLKKDTFFKSYEDHRMAMCVAPLALIDPIIIEDETVVKKSYPKFWTDLESVGFEIEYL